MQPPIAPMLQRILLFAASAMLAVACASSGDNDADTSPDGNFRDAADVPDDTEQDTRVDTTPDVPDTTVGDTTFPPDTSPIDCEVMGDECESSAIFCVEGENTVGFCSRCGAVLRTEACDTMEVCSVIDGAARCRPCEGDECPVLDACEANTRRCLDYNTVEICGPDGRVDNYADCAAGRRCFNGSCGNPGGSTGDECTTNIGSPGGCAGHSCVCGTEFQALEGMAAACAATPALAAGYCSTSGCDANGCDYAHETCADFSISDTFGGGRYCVANEGCDRRGAACGDRAGLKCVELPGRRTPDGPVEWDWACWVPSATVGERCARDSDCLGGECRVRSVGGNDVSYCVAPCGAEAACPSHAACVEDPAGGGDYVCLAYATGADCPRIDSEPLNIAPTPPMPRYGAGQTSVCYFAR